MNVPPVLVWSLAPSLCLGLIGAAIVLPVCAAMPPAAGAVRFDFENGDLQGWKVVEGKFDRIVTGRPNYHNGGAYASRQGKFHLSTLEGANDASNDAQRGVIESPVFLLDAPELSFLIGGGSHMDTYVALCTADGREQVKACGKDREEMSRVQWSLPKIVRKAGVPAGV